MPARTERLYLRLRRTQVIAERGFGDQATSHRPRENRVGYECLIDRILRIVYELLK
jgi:hypothetical protein